eukprot:COSAG06_NODE_471_length_15318_cov_24.861029_9_plen_435_part_00
MLALAAALVLLVVPRGCAEEEERSLYGSDGLAARCSGAECTPLLWAAAASGTGSYEDMQRAIAGGARLDDVDKKHGSTALMKAAHAGRLDLVRLLLESGAAVDAQQREGATALMAAAQEGHTEVVAALLQAGAEPSLRSYDGWWHAGTTAYDIALREGYEETCGLLRAAEDWRVAPPASLGVLDSAWQWLRGLSRSQGVAAFFFNFGGGRVFVNLLGRRLLAPSGVYMPGWAVCACFSSHSLSITNMRRACTAAFAAVPVALCPSCSRLCCFLEQIAVSPTSCSDTTVAVVIAHTYRRQTSRLCFFYPALHCGSTLLPASCLSISACGRTATTRYLQLPRLPTAAAAAAAAWWRGWRCLLRRLSGAAFCGGMRPTQSGSVLVQRMRPRQLRQWLAAREAQGVDTAGREHLRRPAPMLRLAQRLVRLCPFLARAE